MLNFELSLLLGTEKALSLGVKASGVRRSQLVLIILIGNSPGCQISHLARLLEVKHQTASIRLGILMARGYIYRHARKFYLTGRAQEIFDSMVRDLEVINGTYRQAICRRLGKPVIIKQFVSIPPFKRKHHATLA
jgi:predicted ArsR family transcriptional regulator